MKKRKIQLGVLLALLVLTATAATVYIQAQTPPIYIFQEGFESCNMPPSGWTLVGSGLSCSDEQAKAGSYSMKSVGSTAAYIYKTFTGQQEAYARIYIYIESEATFVRPLQLRGDGKLWMMLSIGSNHWAIYYVNDGGGHWGSAHWEDLSLDTWYCFEIAVKRGTANDGWYKCWKDGTLYDNVIGQDNDGVATEIDEIRIGRPEVSGSYTHYIDCVVVDDNYIGPEAAPPKTGTLTVDTTPVKGEVFVNGVSWGKAPQNQTVSEGNYTVSFGDVAGYVTPPPQTATVVSGQTTSVLGTYEPAADNPPQYTNVGANTTYAGTSCKFYASWTDETGLSGFIFGTNNTGSWQNQTWSDPWSGNPTTGWSNIAITLNPTVGIRIEYTIWCNDTSNNWNDTGIQFLITTAGTGVESWNFDADTVGQVPSGWTEVNGTTRVSDTYSVSPPNSFKFTGPSNTVVRAYAGSIRQNLTLQVKVKEMGSGSTHGVGISFRYQDHNNYYCFHYRVSDNLLRLMKKVNGVSTVLVDVSEPLDTNWHTLKVEVQGWGVKCYLDGVQKIPSSGWQDLTGHDLESGTIALHAWSSTPEGYFDDVIVEDYPPATGTATLNVDTTPVKGEVFVNGKSWGVAPQTRSVDPGTYVISYGEVTGYITPGDDVVTLLEGENKPIIGVYEEVTPPPSENYELLIDADPVSGITIVVTNSTHTFNVTAGIPITLTEGNYTITPPSSLEITYETWNFKSWSDGETTIARTINLNKDTILLCIYEKVP